MSFKFEPEKVESEKLILTLEIELLKSSLTAEEAEGRINYVLNNSQSRAFSELIVFLLRETKSSMWELRKCEIK